MSLAAFVSVTALVAQATVASAAPPAASPVRAAFDDLARADVVSAIGELRDGATVQRFGAGTTTLGGHLPAPVNGRYRAGSVTKTFVATVVLQLVGEGRLALTDPVGRWLPGVLPNGSAVTVRDLLQHTSGLYDYTADLLPADHSLLAIRFRTFPPRDLVAIANAHGTEFPPGTRQAYSNTDYILLGMMIAQVTGRPYGAEIERRIIRPLGLSGTSMPGTFPLVVGPHAHVYVGASAAPDARPVDVTVMNPSMAGAAGEIVSTTADLNKFLHALVGGRLLRPAELRAMLHAADGGFGLGVEVADLPCGVRVVGHGGGGPGFVGFAFTSADGARQLSLTAAVWGPDRDTLTERVITAQTRVLLAAFCP